MLALDTTIGCIEASESEVLALFRSAPLIAAASAGSRPESREGYVCAIRKKTNVQVYFALVADNRRIFVYTESGKPDTEEEYDHTLQEALGFARLMGFQPEPVDLNYSAPMREVVLRNIKILRPPGSKVKALLKHGTANAPTPTGSRKLPPTEFITAAAPVVSVAPVASPKLKTEAKSNGQEERENAFRSVINDLRRELDVLTAQRDTQTLKVQELSALQHAAAAELASVRKERAELAAERDLLSESAVRLGAASSELAALRGKVDLISRQRDEADRHRLELSARCHELEETVDSAREAAASLTEARDRALSRAEESAAEMARATASVGALPELKRELEVLAAENDAQAAQLEKLSKLRRTAEEELASASVERAGLEEELASASEERDRLEAELASASKERTGLETELASASDERAGLEAELASLKEERARLTAERDALAQSTAGLEAASGKLAPLESELVLARSQRDEANRRLLELAAEHATLAQTLASSRAEVADLIEQRDSALRRTEVLSGENKTVSGQREALRTETAALSAQKEALAADTAALSAQKEALAEQTAALGEQREALAAQAAALGEQREALADQTAALGAEGEALAAQTGGLSSQREAALLRVTFLERQESARALELDDLRAEVAELAAEREMLREQGRDLKSDAESTEAQRPRPTNPPFEQAESQPALVEMATPGSWPVFNAKELPDLFPICIPRAEDPKPAPSAGCTVGCAAPSHQFPQFSEARDDFFSSSGGEDEAGPGRFMLQPNLTAIEYLSPDEVVELHRSINPAYLSPEGKGQEICNGYVCCLNKGGTLQVFAALLGAQSGRTMVYLPEVQPENEQAYAKAVLGAIGFAEQVGFMMEPVQLGASPLQHRESVMRCPVLRSVEQE